MVVIGRDGGEGETVEFGRYRAPDGSAGAHVELDCEHPHAALVVGKRGYGKSYTLGVLAEGLAAARGVAPVVVDPMGVFETLAADGGRASVVPEPRVDPGALPPTAWCDLVGLDPESAAGAALWRAAATASTLSGVDDALVDLDCTRGARRAARNHVALARSWDVFDPDGLDAAELASDRATVLDVSGRPRAAANAVVRAVASTCYRGRSSGTVDRLPWLLLDEAHAFFGGVAEPALRTVLTRGRQPGVSLVAATQRPGALPDVAASQADVLVVHRLTDRSDRAALERARPSYAGTELAESMPTRPGDVTVVDDATERVHAVRVRERETPHGGGSPRASEATGPECIK
ncbi:ATP-binding protein [Haloarchaeobius sp. HRN-SO-5]|uniref:ATP-binding protein n=1 Tax=Haloarchaeobius sp. HRN-SO-5 TaxID=3446118 RepID=UPI003EB71D6D